MMLEAHYFHFSPATNTSTYTSLIALCLTLLQYGLAHTLSQKINSSLAIPLVQKNTPGSVTVSVMELQLGNYG